MGRIGAAAFFVLLTACVAGEAYTDGAPRPALDLTEKGETRGDGANTRFGRSVAARYAGGMPVEQIIQDLVSQGFSCDDDGSYCTRAVVDGVCADAWTVNIEADARASGTLVRRCMGAMADDE